MLSLRTNTDSAEQECPAGQLKGRGSAESPHLCHGAIGANALQVHHRGCNDLVDRAAGLQHRLDVHRRHCQGRRLPARRR